MDRTSLGVIMALLDPPAAVQAATARFRAGGAEHAKEDPWN
jgi:hypothetical protein